MSSTTGPLPRFMRSMTPEKFKALSKEEQRAYNQKANAVLKKLDTRIDQRNAENHKTLAFGIAQLVQLDPAVEWEIVRNCLKREGKVIVDQEFTDTHPAFVDALASFELEKMSRARKAAGKTRRSTHAPAHSAGEKSN